MRIQDKFCISRILLSILVEIWAESYLLLNSSRPVSYKRNKSLNFSDLLVWGIRLWQRSQWSTRIYLYTTTTSSIGRYTDKRHWVSTRYKNYTLSVLLLSQRYTHQLYIYVLINPRTGTIMTVTGCGIHYTLPRLFHHRLSICKNITIKSILLRQ